MNHILRHTPPAIAAFVVLTLPAGAAPAPIPPNIVVIITDDMSWEDSGPYGNRSIHTPNLDRLAREGMRFDEAWLTISSCSQSRAAREASAALSSSAHGPRRSHYAARTTTGRGMTRAGATGSGLPPDRHTR